ncbi:YhcN/YlaJ family sporulation lipoprotein [Clostridium sp. JNZ J1-5]
MNFRSKKNILIVFTILLFSISIIGCTNRGTNPPPSGRTTTQNGTNPDGTMRDNRATSPNQTPNVTTNPNNTPNDRYNTSIGNPGYTTNDLSSRAQKIENAVNGISGVRGSRVVISNERALVGVDMAATTEGTMTNDLKANIERVVKSTDTRIKTVAVSADPDIFKRITNVGEGIRSGRPFSEFGNEVEEIFRRIVPTTR